MANNTEKALIGCLTAHPQLMSEALRHIDSKDLQNDNSKVIFDRLKELYKENENYDLTTITDNLPTSVKPYLLECESSAVKKENFYLYLERVKNNSLQTQLISDLEELSKSNDFKFKNLLSLVEEKVDKVKRNQITDETETVQSITQKVIEDLEYQSKTDEISIPTGLDTFDKVTGGLKRKKVVVIGAPTSFGKTSLQATIARNICLYNKTSKKINNKIAFFTLEDAKEEMIKRFISAEARVDNQKLENPTRLTESDWGKIVKKADDIVQYNMNIYDQYRKLDDIALQIQKTRPDVVFIDFIQYAKINYKNAKNWHQNISFAMADLEFMAKKYDCCIIVGSQMSRSIVKDQREPNLADLKESSGIEENTHIVMFIHWPYRLFPEENPDTGYPWREDEKRDVWLIIAKNKTGPTNKFQAKFYRKYYTFINKEGSSSYGQK